MILHVAFVLTLSVLPILSEKKLETSVTPQKYDIEIKLVKMYADYAPSVFSGKVTIEVLCCTTKADKRSIKLHSKKIYGLKILDDPSDIKVEQVGYYRNSEVPVEKTFYEDSDDVFVIQMQTALQDGSTYRLTLNYDGEIDEKNGYVIWHDERNYIVATNSERQIAFPCFDEPNMRATFKIKATVVHGEGTFLQTWPAGKFPPSQIAFVATDLKLNEAKIDFFAKKMKANFLTNFEDSSPTLDQLTECMPNRIPNVPENKDFIGKVAIDEVKFLVIPETGVEREMVSMKWGIANLSENEYFEKSDEKRMFHYYVRFTKAIFGGLVSPDSWESAMYFNALAEFVAVLMMPEPTAIDNFLKLTWERPSEDLDEIMEKGVDSFQRDITGKNKGLLLFRMIYAFQKQNFISEVQTFLNTYKYKTASLDNLWQALKGRELTDGSDWRMAIKQFTDQEGYPILTVMRDDPAKSEFNFDQEPFVGSFKERMDKRFEQDNSNRCWNIPISYDIYNLKDRSKKGATVWNYWLTCEPGKSGVQINWVMNTKAEKGEVAVFNIDCLGMYRVKYHDRYWANLVLIIKTNNEAFSTSTLGCILHDAFSLAWLGYQTYDKVFELLPFLKDEHRDLVWSAFFYGATDLNEILQSSKEVTYQKFRKFVFNLIETEFVKRYAVSNYFDRLSKNIPINTVDAFFVYWACYVARIKTCTTQAEEIVDKWIQADSKGRNILKAKGNVKDYQSLLRTAYCTVLSEKIVYDDGLNKKADFLKNMLIKTKETEAYREGYFEALRCMTDPGKINSFLDWACTADKEGEKGLSLKDKQKVFLNLAKGTNSFQTTLKYFNEHVSDKILPTHKSVRFLARIVSTLTPMMSPDEVQKMETFIASSPALKGKERIKKAFDAGKAANSRRAKWLEKNDKNIQEACEKKISMTA